MEQLNMGQFGVMNALRTGNIVVDMAVAMVIPLLFKLCLDIGEKLKPQVIQLIEKYCTYKQEIFLRNIEYVKRSDSWGYDISDSEQRNNILQKAIAMHLGCRDDLHYKSATFSLVSIPDANKDVDDEEYQSRYGSTAGTLRKYNVSTLPPEDDWVTVSPSVEFKQELTEKEDTKDGPKATIIVYSIRSQHPKGEELVNAWVRKVFNEYIKRVESQEDTKRYMYTMLQAETKKSTEGEESAPKRLYKRYQLSDEKSFNSLFIPEKDGLLRLIHHFEKKEGKFAIEGYPHKLGLLLHGPPGTGKTSLIKALAQHTGRHIVSVPLSRIKTNQELMDVMFDQSFGVSGQELPIKIPFGQVIFVMEDVDAAGSVVQRRTSKSKPSTVKTTKVKLTRDSSPNRKRAGGGSAAAADSKAVKFKDPAVSDGGEEDVAPCVEIVRQDSTVVEEVDEVEATPAVGEDTDALLAAMLAMSDDAAGATATSSKKQVGPSYGSYGQSVDKLDLAGVLNVLDGVVDAPNRILIMTTNHPEKLDPALIRPGRINRKIYLGYMQCEEATQMVQHYFGRAALTDTVRDSMRVVFDNPQLKLTPAQVEQQCAEHDFVEDFLLGLQSIKTKY